MKMKKYNFFLIKEMTEFSENSKTDTLPEPFAPGKYTLDTSVNPPQIIDNATNKPI